MFQLREKAREERERDREKKTNKFICNVATRFYGAMLSEICERLSFTLVWVGRRRRPFRIDNGRLRQAFTLKLQIRSFQAADRLCFEFCALSRKVAKFSILTHSLWIKFVRWKLKFCRFLHRIRLLQRNPKNQNSINVHRGYVESERKFCTENCRSIGLIKSLPTP